MRLMLNNVSKYLFTLTVIAGLSTRPVNAITYVAKQGDTLSEVLYENNFKPIYGKKGALKQTLKLNPGIRYDKGNKIYPGTKIVLAGTINQENAVAEKTVETPEVEKVVATPEIEKVVETPAVVPPVIETREISNVFDQSFFWQLSPSVSWKELSASDSNSNQNSQATALSDMSYGANVLYGMRFSEGLDIYSRLFVESVKFVSDNSINVVNKNITTSALGVGVFYKKKLQLEVLMGDELFLTSPNTTSVEIKKVSLPQFKTSYKNEFYQFQEATLSYALSGKVLLPRAAAEIDPNFSYGAGAGIEAKLRNQSFLIGYEKTFLKASDNSTDSQNIFWRFTWETP